MWCHLVELGVPDISSNRSAFPWKAERLSESESSSALKETTLYATFRHGTLILWLDATIGGKKNTKTAWGRGGKNNRR